MTKLRVVLTVGTVLMVVAGCKPVPQPEQSVVTEAPTPITDLEGTSWVAESITGEPVAEDFESTASFESEGRVTGNAGCNGYFGAWGTDGDGIAFGHIGATSMMCPEEQMEQEQSFLEVLESAERFELKDAKLFIYSPGADQPTVLRPPTDESAGPAEG